MLSPGIHISMQRRNLAPPMTWVGRTSHVKWQLGSNRAGMLPDTYTRAKRWVGATLTLNRTTHPNCNNELLMQTAVMNA